MLYLLEQFKRTLSRHKSLYAANRHFDDGAAAKEPTELFIKNIGLC